MSNITRKYDVHVEDWVYDNVKILRHGPILTFEKLSDDKKTNICRTITGPYTLVETIKLDCGHKLESYYEEDGGNAGCFPHCKECDEKI